LKWVESKNYQSKEIFLFTFVIQMPNLGFDLGLVDLGSMMERQLFVVLIPSHKLPWFLEIFFY
jgi:hypothetical protein